MFICFYGFRAVVRSIRVGGDRRYSHIPPGIPMDYQIRDSPADQHWVGHSILEKNKGKCPDQFRQPLVLVDGPLWTSTYDLLTGRSIGSGRLSYKRIYYVFSGGKRGIGGGGSAGYIFD